MHRAADVCTYSRKMELVLELQTEAQCCDTLMRRFRAQGLTPATQYNYCKVVLKVWKKAVCRPMLDLLTFLNGRSRCWVEMYQSDIDEYVMNMNARHETKLMYMDAVNRVKQR